MKKIMLFLLMFLSVILISCDKDVIIEGITLEGEKEGYVGDEIVLKATISADGKVNERITFSSSDEEVVTVDDNGLVLLKKSGKVTITATIKDKSDFLEIEVKDFEINVSGNNVGKVGEKIELTVSINPDREYSITSSDEEIATVNGLEVSLLKKGIVTIKITCGSYFEEHVINVEEEENSNLTDTLEIKSATLNNEKNALDIAISYDSSKGSKIDDVYQYGIIYSFGKITSIEELTLENTTNHVLYTSKTSNECVFELVDLMGHYNEDINVRIIYGYKVSDQDSVKLSKSYQTFNLYELAKKSEGAFCDEIIDEIEGRIKEVRINLDTAKYSVSCDSEDYSAIIEETKNYDFIVTIITIAEGKKLSNSFKLYVNNKEIDKSLYTVNDSVIRYSIDDPNWTDIY